ncbi:MAG TPA: CDP-alcohol phosphatidyltransferase family protein [Planctomycetota bacterium]|nr:CDP-alcohol phosphatidyltransferase family protein [Planctomycetota bacterium]
MREVIALPNLLTLANAFCGLLAISKGIDALALDVSRPELFYAKMEVAAGLIFLGMVFDMLDGKVARWTRGSSAFGAQLDSFADALTFGCAPALLCKMLIEHEGPLLGYSGSPRLHFLCAAAFSLMAILRLVRFNLETEPDLEAHQSFKGLPSPAAAGAVSSAILLYLVARQPGLEMEQGVPTPVGYLLRHLDVGVGFAMPWWYLLGLAALLPTLGFLMVSRVRYTHMASALTRRGTFLALVYLVFGGFLFWLAPIPILFFTFNGFVVFGVLRALFVRRKPNPA